MSWLDEAVARRLQEQREAESGQMNKETRETDASALQLRQQQTVEAFDPLVQRLLQEYGEYVFPKNLLSKRFVVRLVKPGHSSEKSWGWHWHLYSLVQTVGSVEVHPRFTRDGTIGGFTLRKGQQSLAVNGYDETALKEGLTSLYLK